MYLRRLQIDSVTPAGDTEPCPIRWLDSFAMRNFTNDSVFDDTLPLTDGLLEAGLRVPLDLLQTRMADWFRRKGYLQPTDDLRITELEHTWQHGANFWRQPPQPQRAL